jgi:hypothetical protein
VAELSDADSGEFIGIVFEDPDGWREEIPHSLCCEAVRVAASLARETLTDYVNRTGRSAPVDLTDIGLSLWLMQKRDGTAMGRRIAPSR